MTSAFAWQRKWYDWVGPHGLNQATIWEIQLGPVHIYKEYTTWLETDKFLYHREQFTAIKAMFQEESNCK